MELWNLFSKPVTTLNVKLFSHKSTILDVSQVPSLLLTTINKCFLRTAKEPCHGLLEWWLLLPSRYFTCSKPTNRTTKNTRVQCEICFELTVKIPK